MTGSAATTSPPELSVVIPVYNEEARLGPGVEAVLAHLRARGPPAEVIVVDDGSTDGTAPILERLASAHDTVRRLTLPANRGKGAAVRAGVLASRGRFVLFSDVDQSTPLSEWERLREAIGRGSDVVIGSREVAGAQRMDTRRYRVWMGEIFRFLRDAIVGPGFIDTQCGFKLFTREAAHEIFQRARLDGYAFDVEILAIALHRGYRVTEVPVRWADDARSKVRVVRDSLGMLRDLLRIRSNRRKGLYGPPQRQPTRL
jgi:dolichyl-phosphate beta-glucosyltransferase